MTLYFFEEKQMKQQIIDLIAERQEQLKQGGSFSGNDPLGDKIAQLLKENFDSLECDFIIESVTHLGWSLSVLYDDNGRFAVVGDGTQPVVAGDDLLEGHVGFSFFIEKEDWHSTIREALRHYLFERE
jgi:hypothetical protein